MITKEQFKEQVKASDEFGGGCLNGYLTISYGKLVDLLGEPNCEGDDYKVDAQWSVTFDGEIFAIYNYKNGKNYCGEEGDNVEDIGDWHIGGNNKEKASKLISLFKEVE